jgi:hypothetical protein
MAGQFRTTVDLVTEVLANLGVLSSGEPTAPEDFNYVAEKIDPTIRLLAGLEIAYIADANNIPGMFFSPLADCVTSECCAKFGIVNPELDGLLKRGMGIPPGSGAGCLSLKQLARGRATYEILQSDFF